jgi:phage FluMu gp28-like protein
MNESPEITSSILLKYQRDWIADTADVKVMEKSRQIGLTLTESADDALTAAESGRGGMDTWYVGYNKDMALEFIEAAGTWARKFNKAAGAIEQFDLEDESEDASGKSIVKNILAYRIQFASGHKVVALSSRPSNLRGKHGCVVIDEAAFHEHLDELIKAAMALLIWGGKVRIISTHNGADSQFNELVNQIRAKDLDYSIHRVTIDDALRDGLYHKICEVTGKEEWSAEGEAAWRAALVKKYGDGANEELLCVPRNSGGVYLPTALIESCMRTEIPVLRWSVADEFVHRSEGDRKSAAHDWIEENLEPALERLNKNLMSFFGQDFGRSGDLTVIWPVQLDVGLIRRTPFVVELRNVPFQQQEEILFYVVDHLPHLCGGAMDARGNGQQQAETAMQRYGNRVERVMLTAEWYRENMPRYKAAFEDGTFTLPKHPDILSDHRAFRMDKGVAQIPANARTVGTDGNKRHGDSGIAGVMAYHASTMPKAEYAYTPAVLPSRSNRYSSEDPTARDAYEDAKARGGRGRRRLFGRGAW